MLNFLPPSTESELRSAIVACGRICYERHLISSSDGNISVRMEDGRILLTPSGVSKGRMCESDLLMLDIDGKVLAAKENRRPSSETSMHLEVYKQRSAARAVIHAHPIFATTLTVAGLNFPVDMLPEVILTLGDDVPTTAYATPASHEDAEVIRPLIKDYNAILLRQHGSLTVGKDLDEALIHLERVEHVAEIFWRAQMLGTVKRLPDEARARLFAIRKEFFNR